MLRWIATIALVLSALHWGYHAVEQRHRWVELGNTQLWIGGERYAVEYRLYHDHPLFNRLPLQCPPGCSEPLFYYRVDPHLEMWYPLWVLPSASLSAVVLLWRYRRRFPVGHCARCGYDLTGNRSGACPECGTPIPSEQRERIPATNDAR